MLTKRVFRGIIRNKHIGGIGIKTFFETVNRHNQPYRRFILIYFLLAAVMSAAIVVMTHITGEMGEAAVELDLDALVGLVILLTIIMGVRLISSAISTLILGIYGANTAFRFRVNFARHFLRLPFSKIEEGNSGERLSIFSTDLTGAFTFTSWNMPAILADFASLFAILGYMFFVNIRFTLFFLAFFPVLIILNILISGPIQKHQMAMSQERANFNAIVNDSLQNSSTIIAFSLDEIMEERYLGAYDKFVAATRKFIKSMLTMVLAGMLLTLSPLIFISLISGFAVIDGEMTLAIFIAYTAVASTASDWLLMLSQRLGEIRTNQAMAARANEFLLDAHEDLHKGQQTLPNSNLAVEFDGVSFSYQNDELVLDNISFSIAKGERVAIIGGSGSGKSTLLKLLLGLYPSQSGVIRINNTPTDRLAKSAIRATFAYVPQDSYLLPESIGENIAGARGDLDNTQMARLEAACRNAGVLDFVNSLSGGFRAQLSEAAENISGGQRQRIALARALYANAPIILFDEATANLDPATEAAILQTFNKTAEDKTIIMVAHRPQSVAFCDKIITMENGRIISQQNIRKTDGGAA